MFNFIEIKEQLLLYTGIRVSNRNSIVRSDTQCLLPFALLCAISIARKVTMVNMNFALLRIGAFKYSCVAYDD